MRLAWKTWISDPKPVRRQPLDILGIGEALIEMVRLPEDNDGRPAFVQSFGGDTSTAVIAAARQGARCGYLTGISDDMFGQAYRQLWSEEGVDVSFSPVRISDPTGLVVIDPDPAGRKFSYARRGTAASHFDPKDVPGDVVAATRVLHLSGITLAISETMRAAALKAVAVIKAAGGKVSLDLNFRPALWSSRAQAEEIILSVARDADYVFPSDDETEMLLGVKEPDAIADLFLSHGAEIVACKQGAEGAYLATAAERFAVPPVPTVAVDSAGAGDSFAGSFLAWHLETGDVRMAAERAAEVAACTVSGLGAVGPIPRRIVS